MTVCHKWSRIQCKYQCALGCSFGVHYNASARHAKWRDGTGWSQSAGNDSKRQRTQRNDENVEPPSSNEAQIGANAVGEEVRVASAALIALLLKEEHTQASLRRMLLAFHPDKVKGAVFEAVFNNVTVKINQLRETL